MVQMFTAYTTEVDEIEDGINELLTQIDMNKLRKNSVGIITCNYDFLQTGFISELYKKLNFDVIGMTTLASANNHGMNMYALSLTVLTSNDVIFTTGMSGSLNPENCNEKIPAFYSETAGKTNNDPSMIISFFPFLKTLSGAVMLHLLDEACGGIPIWGSLATNIEVNYERVHSFRNGETGQDAMTILLLQGNINPEFVVISIPEQNIQINRGMITKSDGCILIKVNDMPAQEYFKSIGIPILENATTVNPLMVYYEGNTEPVALGIYSMFENGSFLCGGEMTVGATLAVGEIKPEGIITSAEEGLKKLLETGKKNGILMLPCVTRYVMLTTNQNGEMELAARSIRNSIPFMLGYSGGEICPVRDSSGRYRNRFHNYTFSACIF